MTSRRATSRGREREEGQVGGGRTGRVVGAEITEAAIYLPPSVSDASGMLSAPLSPAALTSFSFVTRLTRHAG